MDSDGLDAARFALVRRRGSLSRWLAALPRLAWRPADLTAILGALIAGKRLRARQRLATVIGLDHESLWLPSRAHARDEDGPDNGAVAVLTAEELAARRPPQAASILLTAPGHTLLPGAAKRVAEAFATDPTIQALYGDALLQLGERGEAMPLLRPAFDPDYLMAVDYIGPVAAIRASAVAEVGAAPTLDLLLRVADRFGRDAIRHCPRILSIWRPDGAGEGGGDTRAERMEAARKSLTRKGFTDARVEIDAEGVITVLRSLPEPRPLVSLIVPTRDRLDLLEPCIRSLIARTDWPVREILICDNESREPETLAYFRGLEARGEARIVSCPGPFDFAGMNNRAAAEARGRLLAFVNNDVEAFSPDWLELMAREALRPDVGAVGARLIDGDGRIQHGGVILGLGGLVGHSHRFFPGDALGYLSSLRATRAVSAVTAACLVVEARKFAAVGGFDAQAFTVDFNDVDLCLRLNRAGHRTLFVGGAVLHHREASSRRWTPDALARHGREVAAFKTRWGPLLAQDPHHHSGFDPDLGSHSRLR